LLDIPDYDSVQKSHSRLRDDCKAVCVTADLA
jgi:hypothetical protein